VNQVPDKEITPVDKPEVIEQAVAQLAKHPRGIRDLVKGDEFKAAIAAVLPDAIKPARFVRVTLNAMMRNPDLIDCTKESFFRCCLDLSSYGLEPDGRMAHLIPFKNSKLCMCGHPMDLHKGQECTKCNCRARRTAFECTLIIDYKGLAALVRRSGDVSIIHADVVYNNDEWSFAYGTDGHLKHKPNLKDRGAERIAYYSYARLKDKSEDFMVMSPAEVERIHLRSKSPSQGPWVTDYDQMGIKTAFRRHSKWLPLSPEVRDAIERDDEAVDIGDFQSLSDMMRKPEEPEFEDAPQEPKQSLRDRVLATEKKPEETKA
jgi:recombination protein RecT